MSGDDSDDRVGYKRPPLSGRFKPGNRASPGRPKKKRAKSQEDLMAALLDEEVVATVGGKKRKMTMREMATRSFINKGINGSAQDAKRLLDQMPPQPQANDSDGSEISKGLDKLVDKLMTMRENLEADSLPRERAEIAILQRFPEVIGALERHWEEEANGPRRAAPTRLLLQFAHAMGRPDGRSLAEKIAMEGVPEEPSDWGADAGEE
ncbi:MAG: DUF5681 domain-containing protein [Sphingosinicella sp.]|uniref:DUF5681 domain-containing protein n=1 Tax=Sphingosinicella sp. TaxID=1917971 RepID=UPI0040380B48